MQTDSKKHDHPTDANNVLADVYCPCCGLDTPQLFEGYCKPCLEEKQYQLDTHNNHYDRWGKLDYKQRNAEISKAINFR
jgi:hypothetical protein